MALPIGDTAPDFEAETTEGQIKFHDWIGDWWAVLFSHPRDFTPVCTTELGYMASIKPDFDSRNTKIIGLSVDPLDNHEKWAKDIEETQGTAPNYPIIADTDFNVSKLYGMLPADVEGEPTERTPAQNQTVRNVFVIGPDKKVKLVLVYPMTTGRNFDEVLRVIDSLQLTANHKVATPAQWQQGDDVIIAGSVSDEAGQGEVPRRLGVAAALPPDRAAARARTSPPRARQRARGGRSGRAGRRRGRARRAARGDGGPPRSRSRRTGSGRGPRPAPPPPRGSRATSGVEPRPLRVERVGGDLRAQRDVREAAALRSSRSAPAGRSSERADPDARPARLDGVGLLAARAVEPPRRGRRAPRELAEGRVRAHQRVAQRLVPDRGRPSPTRARRARSRAGRTPCWGCPS